MPYDEQIAQVVRAACASRLSILVWGPGEGAQQDYKKRKKIKRLIQEEFDSAEVYFSEDKELRDKLSRGLGSSATELSVPEQELWHLAACDVCVVLDTSKGAGEEIAHFMSTTHARKLLVLTHERYKKSNSFPRSLRLYLNQMFYSDDEYESCTVVARVLVRIKQVALQKLSGISV